MREFNINAEKLYFGRMINYAQAEATVDSPCRPYRVMRPGEGLEEIVQRNNNYRGR
jgi:hypothetical protein